MCGRFTLRTATPVLLEQFRLSFVPELRPRYNIAPTQQVAVVRPASSESGASRELVLMRWGLVPSWAKDPAIGSRMINARADGVAEKPSFRSAFKRRRCLVLADGYYEWQKVGSQKQPYWIHRQDERAFGMAGLWEVWQGGPGVTLDEPWQTCTIITTDANEQTRPVHDRMPVILDEEDYDLWFRELAEPAKLQQLLRPLARVDLQARRVSTHVNNVKNDDPRCIVELP